MTAVFVFMIVAGIAIISAALMLISQNAVHSALFLVLNFLCVAFFFLTLGAPFIALVHVAVYAGAIMVLFLFVIMLLGFETLSDAPQPYKWLPRVALVLALIFLVTMAVAINVGDINSFIPAPSVPQLRVINAVDIPLDVYLNDQLYAEGVAFQDVSAYDTLPAGDYSLKALPAGADPETDATAILGELLTLEDEQTVSLVMVGANGVYNFVRLLDDMTTVDGDYARLTVLNGLPEQIVDLVDPGLPRRDDDTEVLIEAASFGEPVETLLLPADDGLELLVLDNTDPVEDDALVRYRNFDLDRNSLNILIPALQVLTDGSERVVPFVVQSSATYAYGSPQAIGMELFTNYLLPFEMVSVLLLAALVGVIVLTRRELLAEKRTRRPVVRKPLFGPESASDSGD